MWILDKRLSIFHPKIVSWLFSSSVRILGKHLPPLLRCPGCIYGFSPSLEESFEDFQLSQNWRFRRTCHAFQPINKVTWLSIEERHTAPQNRFENEYLGVLEFFAMQFLNWINGRLRPTPRKANSVALAPSWLPEPPKQGICLTACYTGNPKPRTLYKELSRIFPIVSSLKAVLCFRN